MGDSPRSSGALDRDAQFPLQRLTRLYAAKSQIGRTIARTPERTPLFNDICRILVDTAQFHLAWIGWHDASTDQIDIVARYGPGIENRLSDPISVGGADRDGPTVSAFREGRATVSNDLLEDPAMVRWRDEVVRRALRSAAAFPILLDGRVCGTLTVASEVRGYFQDQETALLSETASDIAFALENLARRHERQEAVAAGRELTRQLEWERARFQDAQLVANIGSWVEHLGTGDLDWSAQTHRIFETDPASFTPTHAAFFELIHPEDREPLSAERERSMATRTPGAFTHRIVLRDGRVKVVEQRWQVFAEADGSAERIVGTCLDITERHDTEIRIRRLNRMHAMLSAVNKAVVQEHDPQQLLEAACRIAVSVGGFRMAWIGMVQPDQRHVTIAAVSGVEDGYLGSLGIDLADPKQQHGPAVRTLLERTHVIFNDLASDPDAAPWRKRALARGYRSSGAFPILKNGGVVGTFNLYSSDPEFFDAEEVALLDELSGDIGFALVIHDHEAERRRVEGLLRESEANLRESIVELREVTRRLNEIKEEERARFARDLHDHLGQALTALKMDAAEAGRRLNSGDLTPARERLAEMSGLLDAAMQDMRRVAAALGPGTLEEIGLLDAIRFDLQDVERRGGPACVLASPLATVPIRKDLALVAFRIFQEAMTNVLRHAGATRVDVLVEIDEQGALRLVVRDNGRGLPPPAERRPGTLGLAGMRDRARLADGDVFISGSPGTGTMVAARIPLEPPQ